MLTSDPARNSADPAGQPLLVLASSSPRRLELVRRFYPEERIQVLVPEYDETPLMVGPVSDGPSALVRRLSKGKLDALVHQYRLPDLTLTLAADTIVTIDGHILGKPGTPGQAADMLRLLSGRTHEVMTGLAIRLQDGRQILQKTVAETTAVTFGLLDEAMIDWYIASGEPFDKAGAYGIQGLGAAFVSRIDGSYYNVMGLPVHRLFVTLAEMAHETGSDQLRSFMLPYAGRTL